MPARNGRHQATIVGSSVYNILIIIGWSAIAGKDIMLDWKPLVRDSVFYFITIMYLIGTFRDSDIHFYDGAIAVTLYACYVGFMTQNQKAFAKMDELAVRECVAAIHACWCADAHALHSDARRRSTARTCTARRRSGWRARASSWAAPRPTAAPSCCR